jgi:hypothetical protein
MPTLASDIVGIIASLLRIAGFFILGLGLTWFTLYIIRQENKPWYLQGLVYLVFFGFLALILWRVNPGASGALALGAGGGLLIWGPRMLKNAEIPYNPLKEEPTPAPTSEPPHTPREVASKPD